MSKEKKDITEDVAKVVQSLFASLTKENQSRGDRLYQKSLDKVFKEYESYKLEDPENFDLFIRYQFEKGLNYAYGFFRKEVQKLPGYDSCYEFLYTHYQFMSNAIEHLVSAKEGRGCSVDKSRWLLRQFQNYLITAKKPDMTIDEKTYWKPAFGTADEWMEFCFSLPHLFYGNPERYFLAYSALIGVKQEQTTSSVE